MRAWFFDLDGTLYIDGGISDACRGALEALRAAGDGGVIIVRKTSRSGVTVAVAQEKWSVRF